MLRALQLRLVQVRFGSTWYSYLTSVLDPTELPPFVVADLYRRRWRIEEAFFTVKRLQDKPAGTKRWEDGNGGRFSQPPASADLVQRESEHQ